MERKKFNIPSDANDVFFKTYNKRQKIEADKEKSKYKRETAMLVMTGIVVIETLVILILTILLL